MINPLFNMKRKRKVINIVFQREQYSKTFENFINILIHKSKLQYIEEIFMCYKNYLKKKFNKISIEIYSNRYVENEFINNIKQALKKYYNIHPYIYLNINTKLLGGVKIKINNYIIDGSTEEKLSNIYNMLINIPF